MPIIEKENPSPVLKDMHNEDFLSEKPFAEQVDDVLAGRSSRYNDLKVCDTPQILIDVGCEQLPMLYTQRHLRDAIKPKNGRTHSHGLDIEQIKKMPTLLSSPAMIFDSMSKNDSIVVLTSEIDKDNMPIVASIRPNGKGKYELKSLDSNFITSFYGRENFNDFLENIIAKDKLRYWNKEKSQELFSVLGLQSSKGLNNLDFNIIIHQSRNIVKDHKTDFQKDFQKESNTHTSIDYTSYWAASQDDDDELDLTNQSGRSR